MGKQHISLSSVEGLNGDQLEGIAGGVQVYATGDKKKSEDDNLNAACLAASADAIPQAEIHHTCDAGASASASGTSAQAGASAQAGTSEITHWGDVTVTTWAGATVQAQAQAGPTGASAGAAAAAGFGNHFDLGKGVEVTTEVKGFAGVAVAAGLVDSHLVLSGASQAQISSSIGQKFTSDEFGDGAKVTQTSDIEATAKAEAGGGFRAGADGLHSAYDSSVGVGVKGEVGVNVGNDEYSGGVGARGYSPGSVGAGMSVDAGYEDGKLNISLSQDFKAMFAGYGFDVDLSVQLFDDKHTKGSPEEIKAAFEELMTHMYTQDAQMTDRWQMNLEVEITEGSKELKWLNEQVHSAEERLDMIEEERDRREERIELLSTAAVMHDYETHLGYERGHEEWSRRLENENIQLKQFDEKNAPEIHDLKERLSLLTEERDMHQSLVDDLKAELETTKAGDADNISRLAVETRQAESELHNFVYANESSMINAQNRLDELQDQREDHMARINALEILSGRTGEVTGSAEFRAEVEKNVNFLRSQGMSPEDASRLAAEGKASLAEWEENRKAEVNNLQRQVADLGAMYLERAETLKELRQELQTAQESTFLNQCAQAQLAVQGEADAVQILEFDGRLLQTEISGLQQQLGREQAELAEKSERLQREKDHQEENRALGLREVNNTLAAHPDDRFLKEQLELYEKFHDTKEGGRPEVLPWEIQYGPLRRMAEDELGLHEQETELATKAAKVEDMQHQLDTKSAALEQNRQDLPTAQERLESAQQEAFKEHPHYAAQLRLHAAQERLDGLRDLMKDATGENREHIAKQIEAQDHMVHALQHQAQHSSDFVEAMRDNFNDKYEELQEKFEDLKSIVVTRGFLSRVADLI